MKIVRKPLWFGWDVYVEWAWTRTSASNWPKIHYAIKPEVEAWLKELKPVGWFKRPAAYWPRTAMKRRRLVAYKGRIETDNPPAIRFRRKGDILLLKLTLGGMCSSY